MQLLMQKVSLHIQIRKHILSNINPSTIYTFKDGELSGEQLINLYNYLISLNIEESANELISEFTNDDRTLNLNKLSETLVQQYINRGKNTNSRRFVEIDEQTDNFAMPFGFNANRKGIMSILTSLFTSNVNEQKFPGGHTVLMANQFFGANAKYAAESSVEGFNPLEKRLSYTEKVVNGQKVLVVECMLPAYSKKFFTNGSPMDITSIPEELRRLIGFRIPTSGKHSSVILDIVKFLPKEVGSTIIVADDIVAQMGSDFDVDSLFLMTPSFTNKSELNKNSIEGIYEIFINRLNNKILDTPEFEYLKGEKTTATVDKLYSDLSTILSIPKEQRTKTQNRVIGAMFGAVRNIETPLEYDDNGNLIHLDGEESTSYSLLFNSGLVYDSYSEENNSRSSRNNMILEIMMSVLGNPNHTIEVLRPAAFERNKTITAKLKELIAKENDKYNPVNPISQLRIRRKAVNGRNNILPIAATWNTGIATLQTLRSKIVDPNGISIMYDAKEGLPNKELTDKEKQSIITKRYNKLRKAFIAKVGEENIVADSNDNTILVRHKNIAWNEDGTFHDILGSLYTDILAEDVDNAADTLKGDLPANVNPYTYNVWAAIKSVSGNTNYAAYFINQPIIRDLVSAYEKGKGILGGVSSREFHETIRKYQTKLFTILVDNGDIVVSEPKGKAKQRTKEIQDVIQDRIDRYGNLYYYPTTEKDDFMNLLNEALDKYGIIYKDTDASYLTNSELIQQISNNQSNKKESIEDIVTQLSLLNTWQQYNDIAKDISNNIRITNIDKLGVSPNFEATKQFNEDIINIQNKSNIVSTLTDTDIATAIFDENKYSMLKAFKTNSNDLAMQYFQPLFITEHTQFVREVNKLKNRFGMSLKGNTSYMVTKYENYLNSYLLKDVPLLKISPDEQKRILGITLTDEQQSFAMKIYDLRIKSNIKNDAVHFLNILDPDPSPQAFATNKYQIVRTKVERNDPLIENEIHDSVLRMYFEPSIPEQKELVEEAIKYSYLTNGLSFGRNSLISYIPEQVLKAVGIEEVAWKKEEEVRAFDEKQSYFPNNILDKFILNNVDNNKLVPTARTEISFIDSGRIYTKNNTPIWSPIKDGSLRIALTKLRRVDNPLLITAPYVKVFFKDKVTGKSDYLVYERQEDEEEKYAIYKPISSFGSVEVTEIYDNKVSIFEDNLISSTITKTVTKDSTSSTTPTLFEEEAVRYYTGNIKKEANTIFVFGSNPEGRHGKGAAKRAIDDFGAKYGQGEGLQGNSYALPTKDLRITKNGGLRSISHEQIVKNIQTLYTTANKYPNKQFKIAYRNTKDVSLNGYTGEEMMVMFVDAGSIPSNIIVSNEWNKTGIFNLAKFAEENPDTYNSLSVKEKINKLICL
jgi:hypothetical protein